MRGGGQKKRKVKNDMQLGGSSGGNTEKIVKRKCLR